MVLIEFHPVAMVFDRDWTHARPYFAGGRRVASSTASAMTSR
ncbi:MAG: hypothetical protein AVDCRST_MAG49-2806 [uncultured Thermomicrobiales bacterium]|uniref:Uncharacterized protein n=1 Tax=uncultured Thermomicrobiales bacterium TaxID=1645740 RepID=A0A6J4V2A7_9BACT|nr:MAG: hypothetical protein AVDCRST_MAG49-2806 [uncultured Thermomicrobiales bacterium]